MPENFDDYHKFIPRPENDKALIQLATMQNTLEERLKKGTAGSQAQAELLLEKVKHKLTAIHRAQNIVPPDDPELSSITGEYLQYMFDNIEKEPRDN